MSCCEQLATDVVNQLRDSDLYITTVESCTGGMLSSWITNISGASAVIKGARVTYSNEEKIALGVPEDIIAQYTVYSEETAVAMAQAGMAAAVRADVSVGITGSISRVDPNNENSTPGEVYIAVVGLDDIKSQKFIFEDAGERWEVKERAVEAALNMVKELLSCRVASC